MEFSEVDREDFRLFFEEVAVAHMPFGKYGPEHYPPRGVPLTDLPPEYLAWFSERGWPSGRLGELMKIVHEIKSSGADQVFEPFRRARGGRFSVRQRKSPPSLE